MKHFARGVLVAALVGCGSTVRVPFGEEGVDRFAVLQLEGGVVSRATGIRSFADSASVYFAGEAIVVGWRSDQLSSFAPPDADRLAADPLRAATGCEPHIIRPHVAIDLRTNARIDPAMVPPLTTDWLQAACPAVDPGAISFDVECKLFRCPLTTTREAPCRFSFDLDCELGRFAGTVWPDGSLCLEPEAPLVCAAAAYDPPRAATYSCSMPEACTVSAYLEAEVGLVVDTIELLDVEPYSPTPNLIGQLVLPPVASRFFGYAHDIAVRGERIAVSVGPGTPFTGCAEATSGTLEVYGVDSLSRTSSAAVPGCVQRLTNDVDGFLGLRTLAGRFELTRFDNEGRIVESVAADPRVIADEVPLLFTNDARPSYFERIDDVIVTAVVTAMPRSGTKVFTWNATTLAPLTRAFLEEVVVVAGARVDRRTVAFGDNEAPGVIWFDIETNAVLDVVNFPPEINRRDHVVSDVTWTDDHALLTLSRKNAGVYPVTRSRVVSRAVVIDDDARPMALRAWPDEPLALAVKTMSTDQVNWPASLAFFDLQTQRFRPGSVPVGHGAPGRMLADDRGRIWVLLPWDAKLLRVDRR